MLIVDLDEYVTSATKIAGTLHIVKTTNFTNGE